MAANRVIALVALAALGCILLTVIAVFACIVYELHVCDHIGDAIREGWNALGDMFR